VNASRQPPDTLTDEELLTRLRRGEHDLFGLLVRRHERELYGYLRRYTGDPELAVTLLAYFDSNQNAKTTAQRLGIHVNTVRQRLATIEDLLGHWGSAARALEIHMALRLWSLSAAP